MRDLFDRGDFRPGIAVQPEFAPLVARLRSNPGDQDASDQLAAELAQIPIDGYAELADMLARGAYAVDHAVRHLVGLVRSAVPPSDQQLARAMADAGEWLAESLCVAIGSSQVSAGVQTDTPRFPSPAPQLPNARRK